MNKLAGLLDPPKKYLCPELFSSDKKLFSHVRNQILNLVYKLVPKENVKSVVLIGTAVGYQWSEDSDVDVNVSVYPPELLTEELNEKRHQLNDQNNYIPGTKHVINIFLTPYIENLSWQDNKLGAYDVLNDTWISLPSKDIRNPEEEYYLPLIYAKLVFKNYIKLVFKYIKSLKELKNLESIINVSTPLLHNMYVERKRREVEERKKQLINFVKSLDSSRKFEYYYGWGTPRKNYRNILYKFIEHSSKDRNIGQYFDYFKELRFENKEKLPWEVKIIM